MAPCGTILYDRVPKSTKMHDFCLIMSVRGQFLITYSEFGGSVPDFGCSPTRTRAPPSQTWPAQGMQTDARSAVRIGRRGHAGDH